MPAYKPHTLMSSITTTPTSSSSEGVSFTRLSPALDQAAVCNTMHTLYPLAHTSQPPATVTDLMAHDGEKYTALVLSSGNAWRVPQLIVLEGRIVTATTAGPLALLLKGRRTRGIPLTTSTLIDATPGWGPTALSHLTTRLAAVRALLPQQTTPLTPDVLTRVSDGGDPDNQPCTLVLLTSTQAPDNTGPVHGCLWLINDRTPDPDDPTLGGVLLAPPSTLTSEHGSIYLRRLPQCTAVLPAAALSYQEAIDLADQLNAAPEHGYLTALARLTARTRTDPARAGRSTD
ncbi:hypothetical protein ACFU5O_28285 [Streptomyces sp. NPDC057445]|uniref:hypothetical protein n=1 Tax=Streptomyces sp. NPDC057445 TaxID=3346136 RepID=UPI0036D181FA